MTTFDQHLTEQEKAAVREAGDRIVQAERRRAQRYLLEALAFTLLDFLDDPPEACGEETALVLKAALELLRMDILAVSSEDTL